jgi:hypothetical protein
MKKLKKVLKKGLTSQGCCGRIIGLPQKERRGRSLKIEQHTLGTERFLKARQYKVQRCKDRGDPIQNILKCARSLAILMRKGEGSRKAS